MNLFGRASMAQRETCHIDLRGLADTVLVIKDHSIIKGHRGREEQNAAFDSGNSQLRWPKGKHNHYPSNAMDVRTWPNPSPLTFHGDPNRMSERELRAEVKRLRSRFAEQPLREDQIYLLGLYKGVAFERGLPLRTGADWDLDGEIADNGFDDYFHVERIDTDEAPT